QRLEDKSGLSSIYNEFGNIYRTQGEFSKALDYYQKSITNHRLIGDEKGNAPMYSNIGDLYLMQGDEQKALEYFEKGLKLYQESDDLLGIATIYSGIGSVKQDEKKVEEALDYLNRSLAISEKINDQQGAITTLLSIGLIYLDEHLLTKALEFCRRSYQLAGQLGDIGNQRDACDCLYESYKHLNNIELALSFHEKMNILDDSMQVEETARQMQQIEFANKLLADSLDQVAKDMEVEMVHQAEIQKKTMNRNLALVFGFFFLLLSIGLYRRWLYMKQSKAIIEKEKERSEALLLNILPSEIADELKAKGTAEARDHEVVSILFTDFKGFTEKAARLSAADLIAEINHCFKAFDLICEEFGIEKIKTIGDAYMAAGGLPVSNPDSVANTIKAGLKMQDFIKNRITEKDENGIAFEMRVGIHTGPVVAGIVGVKKFQYDVWGDTVNTAARMESRGEPGKVNISQDTYYLVKNHADFNFTPRGMMEVKGKGKMWMWFVTEAISPTEPI
ncbi:MAG: tetratricopeptide repeat protein, partial [Saprospiraceae bacterium]|nr:tetratricopeptide repeat protein [Saprospiraceae bacterium]